MERKQNNLPSLGSVIKRYNLFPQKKLGQNFILESSLAERIARAAGDLSDADIVEVGPGPGGLTRALLNQKIKTIYAIERDIRCVNALKDIFLPIDNRVKIIAGDALELDISKLSNNKVKIISNLPYNIATKLLVNWLQKINSISSITCMFQREVADRLVAKPGTKSYGRLSIISQWLCDVKIEFNVKPHSFKPAPKITSTLVTLTPRSSPLAFAHWDDLEKITALAFGQRRKMLRVSLKNLPFDFDALGINPTDRAENLNVKMFCKLAEAYRSFKR